MTYFERFYEHRRNDRVSCAYLARARVRIHADDSNVIREGTRWSNAAAPVFAEPHEQVLKAAQPLSVAVALTGSIR
jgi:hypothetical protein